LYSISYGWTEYNRSRLQNSATDNSSILQPLSTDYGSSILTLFYCIHKYSAKRSQSSTLNNTQKNSKK